MDQEEYIQPENEEHIQFEITPEKPQQEPEPAPQHKKKGKGKAFAKAALAALAAVAIAVGAVSVFFFSRLTAQEKRSEQMLAQLQQQIQELQEELDSKSFTGNGNSISGSDNTSPEGLTPGQVYAKNVHSVVAITSEVRLSAGGQTASGTSAGTGFIFSADGYIVTNHHVVENASAVTVTLHNGDSYKAKLCGSDATNDLAVLKIEAEGLVPAVIGSSDDLIVGDQVAVIGNPLGDLNATLTVGFISGKDRVISTDGSLINMLQTDAAVNPGNSGGPIFNMKGEVVGIITAKYSGTTNSGATIEGIGFAIPMDDVTRKIDDLIRYGYVRGGYLGVSVHDIDRQVAQYYGLPYGVYVVSVSEGYCAQKAGVRERDIIIAVGDAQITCMNDLTRALQEYQGGEQTTVTVWRGGMEVTLNITLDAKPVS